MCRPIISLDSCCTNGKCLHIAALKNLPPHVKTKTLGRTLRKHIRRYLIKLVSAHQRTIVSPPSAHLLFGKHPASAGDWSSVFRNNQVPLEPSLTKHPRREIFHRSHRYLAQLHYHSKFEPTSGAIDSLNKAFSVKSNQQASPPVAVFPVGYIFRPILFGPISESYGRRMYSISYFALYTLFTLACALIAY